MGENLDSNDLLDLAQELFDLRETEGPLREHELERLHDLVALEHAVGGSLDDAANENIYLIHDTNFEAHARELARDMTGKSIDFWPMSCIDWKQAADELMADYTSIDFDGETYYTRDL